MSNKAEMMAILGMAAMFSLGVYDKLIDRGFLYCLPCGVERKVAENGDVEPCPNKECKDAAYNLHAQGRGL